MDFIVIYLVKLALGHIPPQIQQFPDTDCGLFPGDQGCGRNLGALALGYADSLGIVPDGILAPIQIEARAVLAIVFRKEAGVVRLILFEIGADGEAAVLMVGADTKCLIDHLLGQRMRKEGNLVSAFRLRLAENSKIKEGHLLALLCGELADVRLDKVFFFVDELGCPFRHQTPGKHGFFGARWVRAFPHEQPVLLRLIPQALPICNDFGVPVLVSRFQIIGPFLRILVDGEEKLDLLFLILEVIVLIGDNGHDLLFIQKSGQLWAVRFLCI